MVALGDGTMSAGAAALMLAPLLVGVLTDALGMRWAFDVVLPLALTAIVITVIASRAAPHPAAAVIAGGSEDSTAVHDTSLGVPTGG